MTRVVARQKGDGETVKKTVEALRRTLADVLGSFVTLQRFDASCFPVCKEP